MKKFITWLESLHAPIWVDVLRMITGILLVYKGLVFMNNIEGFANDISSVGWIFIAAHLAQVIIFVHLVCGAVLVLGAYTRVMSLLNIPILAGAVLFNLQKLMLQADYMELPVALITLALLVLVFFMGGGEWSLDHKRKGKPMTHAGMH